MPVRECFERTAWKTFATMNGSGCKSFDPLPRRDGRLNTDTVDWFAPNKLGVHDQIGNVREWIEDCHTVPHDAHSAAGAHQSLRFARTPREWRIERHPALITCARPTASLSTRTPRPFDGHPDC